MCSPSAPSAPTSTSQTTIPEYAKPTAERLVGRSEALSESPYQTFGGQRIATATPEQQAARAGVAGMAGPTQFGTGTQFAEQAGLGALAAGQYQPGTFVAPTAQAERIRTGSFVAPGVAEQYMSPFMQQALDVQKAEAIRTAQQGQLGANLAAAKSGTYGGARQTLAMTERERNLQQELNRIQAMGSQTGYEQAQRAFEAEQARRLQAGIATGQQGLQAQDISQRGLLEAQRMAEQSRQFGGTLGLQGTQAATQAAATLGQLGIGQQQQALELAKAKEAYGALGQQEQQRALDLAYQDFITQQQYPYKQLGFLSDILRGSANLAATGGKTVYETPPSMLSQLGGAGLAAAGAYKLLG